MRNKQSFMKVISLCVSAVFIFSFVVSCGGGGSSGGGPAPVTYTTSGEAAASSKSMTGAITLTNTIASDAATSLGGAMSTLAPRVRKAANTDSIANIDPRLKTMVDKMSADLKGSGIKSSVQKLRSVRLLSSGPLSATTTTSGNCAGGGSYTGTVTDNSTASVEDISISVTFANCKDGSALPYNVISGGMSLYERFDGTSYTDTATLSNLTFAVYSSSTSTADETDTLNGTFSATGNNSGETDTVNASFSIAANGTIKTLNINHLSDKWTSTYDAVANTETDDDVMNGSFVFSISSGGTTSFSLTLGFSNLEDKVRYNYSNSSVDEWMNGTLSLSWTPDLSAAGCLPGSLTVTTAAETPLHYNSSLSYDNGACPDSGTMQVNNATIVFGTVNGIEVTVGTDTGYFTCDALSTSTASCTQ